MRTDLRGPGETPVPRPTPLTPDELRNRVERDYKRALALYGRHTQECEDGMGNVDVGDALSCTCGWTATWRALSCPPKLERDR